jgi:hypothetical protein
MKEMPQLETDPRFPSGRWVGFWTQKNEKRGSKHTTELYITFANGRMDGEGRDWVGKFTVSGKYDLADGRCHWTKQYVRRHAVSYDGFNEGKGIWGTWLMRNEDPPIEARGGFHIWPEEMADPSSHHLTEHADVPAELVTT